MIPLLPDSAWTYECAAHLLSRSHMASTRDERIALYELGRDQGVEAAVDSLVNQPDDWDSFPFPDWWDGKDVASGGPTGSINDSGDRLVSWYFEQLRKANPLGAKMFKFFVDHVPIDARPLLHQNKWIYFFKHFDLCRRFSLGNYRKFMHGISWDGGMIWMLNLNASTRMGLNENFARELMELFTLGVDGGYTEEDVINVAKAFTGRKTDFQQPVDHPYTPYLNDYLWHPDDPGRFYYFIDTSEKVVLGKTFPEIVVGESEAQEHGAQVLDHIFEQAACGRYLVWKLWRYFVSPDPPEAIVNELGDRFRLSYDYEIRPLLRDLFMSAAFYNEEYRGNQIKDPGDLLVSCLVNLEVDLPVPVLVFILLDRMGYNVMFPESIAGWPEPIGVGNGWLGPEKILARANLPSLWLEETKKFLPEFDELTYRNISKVSPPSDLDLGKVAPMHLRGRGNLEHLIDELNDRFLPFHRLSDSQRSLLVENYEKNYRNLNEEGRIRELITLILALPEFQLQ
jgi:hypothetical protein